jgi:hypothetical protein
MHGCRVGDLVHIPQASELIDCPADTMNDPQLTIPLRVVETSEPRVGVVTEVSRAGGYVRVFCDGSHWSIRDTGVYRVGD